MSSRTFDVHQHLGEAAVMGESSEEFDPAKDYVQRRRMMEQVRHRAGGHLANLAV